MLLHWAVLWVALVGVVVGGASRPGKTCGETTCPYQSYCDHDDQCVPCVRVCQEGPNQDRQTCEASCQDYIHDQLKLSVSEAYKKFQDTVEWLRDLVAVAITMSCLVALGLVALLGFLWLAYRRHYKSRNIETDLLRKKMSTVSAICNNNDTDKKDKPLRLEMPAGSTVGAPPSVITTTTPISTRHPSEDATLEYAYDNHGLTPSPVLNPPRHETTF